MQGHAAAKKAMRGIQRIQHEAWGIQHAADKAVFSREKEQPSTARQSHDWAQAHVGGRAAPGHAAMATLQRQRQRQPLHVDVPHTNRRRRAPTGARHQGHAATSTLQRPQVTWPQPSAVSRAASQHTSHSPI